MAVKQFPSPHDMGIARVRKFTEALVGWYEPARRPYPWRDSTDPYYVTVCEVFLQRTNAEKVEGVAREFFARFPKPEDVCSGEVQDIERILRPLGLPRRVPQIVEIAAVFADSHARGRDVTEENLRLLPGVGPYTQSALRVMVFGQRDAMVDEHVIRVLRRVFSVPFPPRHYPNRQVREFALGVVSEANPKAYNLALLDLGRLICRKTNPRHDLCPVRAMCDYARFQERQED